MKLADNFFKLLVKLKKTELNRKKSFYNIGKEKLIFKFNLGYKILIHKVKQDCTKDTLL